MTTWHDGTHDHPSPARTWNRFTLPKRDDLLDLDTRRSIFRHIEASPGLHLRELQRQLDMPLGTVEYHLHQMERSGLLSVRDDGRYKAFFVTKGDLDRRDRDVLYYVRQEIPRRICMEILLDGELTHGELTERLPVSASTCSFHLKKLVEAGMLTAERSGRSKHFRVVEAERMANVLVRFRKSFLDDLVDRFARAWLDMGREPIPQTGPGGGDMTASGADDMTHDGQEHHDPEQDPEPARLEAMWQTICRASGMFVAGRPYVGG